MKFGDLVDYEEIPVGSLWKLSNIKGWYLKGPKGDTYLVTGTYFPRSTLSGDAVYGGMAIDLSRAMDATYDSAGVLR